MAYDLTTIGGMITFFAISGLCGLIGGIVSIFISGGYTPSRWIEKDGKKEKYVFGSIKEPITGMFGGILVPLVHLVDPGFPLLIFFSLVAGFGSSKFLKKYIENKTREIIDDTVSEISNITIVSEEENDISNHNNERTGS